MRDPGDIRPQLIEHLRLFGECGIGGVSRDLAWRARADSPAVGASAGIPTLPPLSAPSGPPSEQELAVARTTGGETLPDIRTELGDCTRCKLHQLGRHTIVFGVGNPSADLMFIGEAPGHDEDLQGIPFVGRAGQLLTKIIEAIDLTRDQVYIANVIKCRPPENRNPEPDEVETCEPFLFRQVQVVRPRVIVALGTFAAQALLRTKDPIGRLRGKTFPYGSAVLIATFHPAYLLRSPDRKRDVWEDMKKVRALLLDGVSAASS